MAQGSRPDRVADQIRGELGQLLAREVHDPGIGFERFNDIKLGDVIEVFVMERVAATA